MSIIDQLTIADIQQCLRVQAPPVYDVPTSSVESLTYREAAVLVPLVRLQEQWHVLYIRRPHYEGDMHSGQVAFAGGKRDPEDADLMITALRETYEEIGVKPEHVQVLGQLTPHHSISQFRITPTVGTLDWPYALTLNPLEVARAFTIPLHWLAQPKHHEVRYRPIPRLTEPVPVVYFQEYDNELLWGTTARITLAFLACLRASLLNR